MFNCGFGKNIIGHKKFLLTILLVVGLPFLALVKPYFHLGVPYTHDGENHLARFANYKIALKEGQFPPRFAPNLNNHYGYPVFNYNYPLANILSLPFSLVGFSYEITFKLLMVFSLVSGVTGIFYWLGSLKIGSVQTRLLARVSLLLAPFTINLIYVRGSVGEMMMLGIFPWLLWLVHEIREAVKAKRQLSWLVSTTILVAFLLAHNISVLFGGVIWFVYCLVIFGKDKRSWRLWLVRSLLAFGMTLWFWLPALAEKNEVILDQASLSSQYSNHFVRLMQLIVSPLQFGYSFAAPVDTMSLAVGLSGLLGLVIFVLLLIKNKQIKKDYPLSVGLVVIGLFLLFLQTEYSVFIWKVVPLVSFIQFPWRLSLFFVVLVLPLLAIVMDYSRFWKYVFILVLGVQFHSLLQLQPADYLHKEKVEYDLFSQSTSTANENLPKNFTYSNFADWSPAPVVLDGDASVLVSKWSGTEKKYSVVVNNKSLVVEPTMYFLGWQTEVNDKLVSYAQMKETQGRIGYWLEPGTYQVKTIFTQKTWARRVGNGLSIFSTMIASWYIVHELYQWRKRCAEAAL